MQNRDRHILLESILFATLLLVPIACTGQNVKMIQPRTGATAECSGSSYGFGPTFQRELCRQLRARLRKSRIFTPGTLASGRSRQLGAARPAAEGLVVRAGGITRREKSFRSFCGSWDRS